MATLSVGFNRTYHNSNTISETAWENPVAGVYDGANTEYDLQQAPNAGTLRLASLLSGDLWNGYTIVGKHITVTGEPLIDGDKLIAQYEF